MSRNRVRAASLVAVAYFALLVAGTLLHFAGGGEGVGLRVSFSQPVTWLTAVIAAVIAWGLWQRYAWAWWLGLAAAGFQLFRLGSWLIDHFSFSRPPGWRTLLVFGLLVAFLLLLLSPKARASCNR
jgi:benzodiazapine receptor